MDVLVRDKSGKLVRQEVPEEGLHEHYLAGRVLFHSPNQPVPVKLPDGRVGTIPASEAEEVFRNGGTVATQEEYHKAAAEARSGGIAGGAEAIGAGLARGIGMGTTDPLLVGGAKYVGGKDYANKVRQKLAELKEVHPYKSFGAEMVGAVAPALVGDEAGAMEAPELLRAGSELAEAKGALGAAKAAEGPAAKAVTEAGKVFENPSLPAGNIVPATDESVALHNPALRASDPGLPSGPHARALPAGPVAKLPPELQEAAKLPPAPPGAQIPHAAAEQLGVAGHETIQQAGEYAASRIDEMAQHTSGGFGVRDVLRNSPAGLTSRAGRFAEDMADGAVEELFGPGFKETGAGRVIASAIRLGASGAMEGGLFAVGNEISEDTLGDVDLNAEKLMATFGHGALLGAAFGFGTGAAGGVAKEGGQALLRMLAPKLSDLTSDMMFRAVGAGGGRSPAAKDALRKWGPNGVRYLVDVMPKYGIIDGAPGIEEIFDRLQKAREGVAGKALGDILGGADAMAGRGQLPHWQRLMDAIKADAEIYKLREFGEMHRMAIGLRPEEEAELRGLPATIAKRGEEAELLRNKMDTALAANEKRLKADAFEASQAGGKFYRNGKWETFDPEAAKLSSKELKSGLQSAYKAARGEHMALIRRQSQLNRLWNSSELGQIESVVKGLADPDGRIPFVRLRNWRAHMDKQVTTWGRSAAMGDPVGSMRSLVYKSAGRGAEGTLVESAGKVLPPDRMKAYLDFKEDYMRLRFLENKAALSLAAKYNNQTMALTTKLLGLTFLGHGNPVMAVASMAGHKLIRDRGATATALVLEKMSQLAFIQRAVAKADGAVEKAVDGVIGRASGKEVRAAQRVRGRLRVRGFSTRDTTAATPEEHRTNGADHLKRVSEMANLPNLEDEHVSGALGGASSYAPKHVSSVASAANMATQYLVSKLPQGHDSTQEIASGPARISDLELHDFQHHVEGATDAIKVLHKIGNGTASPTHIEAFKKTHPLMYTELRNKVAERLATLRPNVRESMSMQVQSELAALFAMPVTWAQTPAGMKILQANDIQISQSDGRPTMPQKPGRMAPSRLKNSLGHDMETDIERVESNSPGDGHSASGR